MPKLILIGGDLAGGKSRYANILGDKYNLLVINKDNLKEIAGDNFFAKNREENKKLSVLSFDVMKYIIYKNKDTLVLESNFKDYEMEELKKITKELNYEVLSLVFKGDDEVLHKRFLKRLNENRHYVHKSEDFTELKDFSKMLEGLRKVKYIGKNIFVDCTDFKYQDDKSLFLEVEDFLKMSLN
jgi:tRNA A37 N6-isopentenylltransferase MiaA